MIDGQGPAPVRFCADDPMLVGERIELETSAAGEAQYQRGERQQVVTHGMRPRRLLRIIASGPVRARRQTRTGWVQRGRFSGVSPSTAMLVMVAAGMPGM